MAAAHAAAQSPGYVPSGECAACHKQISEAYRATGMARSFSRATPGEVVEDYYHEASSTHYSMLVRDGRYYQRRWQAGFDRRETNGEEMPVDYVMGSGSHARTFLSRTTRNTLIELPLAWYSEKGGYWAMNPGYETAHPPSHREVAYECMFCHNAYPRIPASHAEPGAEPIYTGGLPEGIDCQRCHGPGSKHVTAARSGSASVAAIRAAIVNPARLDRDRQLEVCMQCHLQTASTRLPGMIRLFDRGPFSYVPGQPLEKFILSFDHAPGRGYDDKFDIAGGAYRFRQSPCFLRSNQRLTCSTCHDPHGARQPAEQAAHYTSVCRSCHAEAVDRLNASARHPAGEDCAGCHMPKRRTDDAVHVVMTDHRIQRPPNRDLTAALRESHPTPDREYQGGVVPYYPLPFPNRPDTALYVALAQVKDGRNLTEGIQQLAAALANARSPSGGFYLALGDAWHAAGDPTKAAEAYRKALNLEPAWERAARFLGTALRETADRPQAYVALNRAIQLDPTDPQAWFELALLKSDEGQPDAALTPLRKAVALNPDLPDVWNSLGVNLNGGGKIEEAEGAFRQAIRIDPFYGTAHGNLARLLAARGDLAQAVYYFDQAANLVPSSAINLYEYALALVQMNRFDDSQGKVIQAIRADPNLAEAHELLGGLLARSGDLKAALVEFGEAVRLKPGFSRAQLDYGATVAAMGNITEGAAHLREAAKSSEPKIAAAASAAMRRFGISP